MKHKRTIISWFYPLILGLVAFNVLRMLSDLTINNAFWHGDKIPHIYGLILSTILCYFMDIIWRNRLNKPQNYKSAIKEYLFVFVELFIFSSIFLFLGVVIKMAFVTNFVNYFVIFITYIPLMLLYYTLMRNEVVNKNYQAKIVQLEKVKTDQAETELKFLKSQYHPHFLFNALNTIYFQVDKNNKEAKQSIEKLSDLLRYQLYDIEKEVAVEQEISYLKSYIAFQQLRMSERLILELYFDPELKEQKIHPLLFQPLIENAFKYVRGDYKIKLEMKLNGNQIQFNIENSVAQSQTGRKDSGIGVENLKRRLNLLYPDKYTLEIEQTKDIFTAKLSIKMY